MPSTTIHFRPDILARIDAVARRCQISRNRFVIQACESAVARDAGEWPEGFFRLELSEDDAELLRQAGQELERSVLANRTNRGASLL